MQLILQLDPETDAKLNEKAMGTGRSREEIALEAIQKMLAKKPRSHRPRSPEAWLAKFREWLASHPVSSVVTLDDSRETI